MEISSLIRKLWAAKTRPRGRPEPKRSLDPGVLRREGILGDPTDPARAAKRARSLIQQGRYAEARRLLDPHLELTDSNLGARVHELRALCAMATGGGDWSTRASRAIDGFGSTNDLLGVARVRHAMGEALLARGRFSAADAQLREAFAAFVSLGERGRAAAVDATRARIPLRAGAIDKAELALNRALEYLVQHELPRSEAFARLDLASVHAAHTDPSRAAREVLRAECLLSGVANVGDRVRIGLARAEALLLAGQTSRAAIGLKHMLTRIGDVEEAEIRARLFFLLAQSQETSEPEVAQGYYIQSRRLYGSLCYDYALAWCDIGLARLDAQLGHDPQPRLSAITHHSLCEWPVLAAELRFLRAQIDPSFDTKGSNAELLSLREYALDNGDHALCRRVESVLRDRGIDGDPNGPHESLTGTAADQAATDVSPDAADAPARTEAPTVVLGD